jgi:hypothetical protein
VQTASLHRISTLTPPIQIDRNPNPRGLPNDAVPARSFAYSAVIPAPMISKRWHNSVGSFDPSKLWLTTKPLPTSEQPHVRTCKLFIDSENSRRPRNDPRAAYDSTSSYVVGYMCTYCPVPLSVAVCGLLGALSVTFSVADSAPRRLGLKVTVIEQFALIPSVVPQVFVCEN